MSRSVIALCGLKRCGKDTVADYMVEKYAYRKIKIADPLKHVCKYIFNLSDDQLETDIKDEIDSRWGTTPRRIMQFFGTEVMQFKIQELLPNVGRLIWMNKLIEDIKNVPSTNFVVGDMRFAHEYQALKEEFGKKVKIIKIVTNRNVTVSTDNHSSEKEWETIPADFTLFNNGTLQELYDQIDVIIKTTNIN